MSTRARIYLDYNATAPLGEPARRAISAALESSIGAGNPSSVHAEGRAARDRVETARRAVAALAGRPKDHIIFTSGGTEANALGVLALAATVDGGPNVVATSPIDHPSLAGAVGELVRHRGWKLLILPVDHDGRIGPGPAAADVGLVAVSAVNHELGTILDPGVLAWARARGARVHVDAVQAAGKLDLNRIDADALALSAHKLGGPQGVGALAITHDAGLPVIAGGHQERGRRAGTENALGIVGFGAAAAAVDLTAWPAVAELGARLEAGLVALGARIHGQSSPRTGATINAAFPGALGDAIVIALDLAGVAASTGAACTSGSIEPSPVLLALGWPPDQAREAIRFSLGPGTTIAEIDTVLALLPTLVDRARQHR
ncbi:MAG TPA: cysteine desulfurase family protein [Kofleriaceae bacterium]|nr:cysteine desulfurase family protein [Kofleriaceae bacterium]